MGTEQLHSIYYLVLKGHLAVQPLETIVQSLYHDKLRYASTSNILIELQHASYSNIPVYMPII